MEDRVAQRPVLDAKAGDLALMTGWAWDAVVTANDPPVIFRRGGEIVRTLRDDLGALRTEPVNADRLRHRLARVSQWVADGDLTPPPMDVVRDMLASSDPPVPVLDRIVRVPVLGPDGSVRAMPGYHRPGRTYLDPIMGLCLPPLRAAPSPEDVARATGLIMELLEDFPFVDPADRAHAVALGLLPFCRAVIDGPTPLHVVEKPRPGTGAGLLVEAISTISTGGPASTVTEGSSEEEWRKRVTSKLRPAPEVVLIDNVRARLSSAALASAITSPIWEDRLLGHSTMVALPVRCVWVATANNPRLSTEMARRSIRIRLDAGMERPWRRTGFRHPRLLAWVSENHGELVWAFLVLARSWVAAGCPPGEGEIGTFEAWSRTLGGILGLAGIEGFLANLDDAYGETDREAAAWGSFVAAWWARFGEQEVGTSDLLQLAAQHLDLGGGGDRSRRTRLGIHLAEARGRRFGHVELVHAGSHRGVALWTLAVVGRAL